MTRVGVIGLGVMGQNHLRIYSELGCKLAGAVETDPVRAVQMSEHYRIPVYPDIKDILDKVDAVSIAVPTSMHSDVALVFLERGIHCLVEKPIAASAAAARRMIDAADRSGAILLIGHVERFNPAVQKLKQMIDQGLLGRLILLSTRRVGPYMQRIRDVGIVVDTATHDIDAVRYLVGREPQSIVSSGGCVKNQKEDFAVIMLDFGGAVGSIEVNWFTPHKVRTLVATGTEGTCYLDYINQTVELATKDGRQQFEITKSEPLKLELEHFLDCIEYKRKPLVDGVSGLRVLEIAEESEAGIRAK